MSDLPPPPPDDSGWSSQPPPPPGSPADPPQPAKGWATLGTGGTVQLASAGRRLFARILDGAILAVVGIIPVAVVFSTAFDVDLWNLENDAAVGISLAPVAIELLYEVPLTATRGQTLGKMALKIRVVQADNGLVPGWGKSAGRWLVPAIPGLVELIRPSLWSVGLLSFLVYASLTWDKARQGWHDKAVKTFVVKV